MLNLSKEQISFLESEFGMDQDKISALTKDEWAKVRSDCFDIEADELLSLRENGYDFNEYSTGRADIASEIADIKYSELKKGEAT